ncbi:MAG: uncharacterized protein JWN44_5282 [Myxococcales bacterium]|nr:uncharacterized protein [Myxococcales bacterium]
MLFASLAASLAASLGCQARGGRVALPAANDVACARAKDGIWCSQWGATGFGATTRWSTEFGDDVGWPDDDAVHWSTLRTPDLDGDGKTDLCFLGNLGIFCAVRRAPGAFGPAQRTVLFADAPVTAWRYTASFAFADLDGDAFADACVRLADGLHCARGNGDGTFGEATLWADWPFGDDAGAGEPAAVRSLRFGDVDGDGLDDVCLAKVGAIYCAVSTGSAFTPATPWSSALFDSSGRRREKFDLVDVDGTGGLDLCSRHGDTLRCARSSGASFVAPVETTLPAATTSVVYGDIDGDGRTDLCAWRPSGLACSRSLGQGGLPFVDVENDALAAPHLSPADGRALVLVDVDGDGRSDACARSQSGLQCALSNGKRLGAVGDPLADFGDSHGWSGRPDIAALAIGRRTQPSGGLANRVTRENERAGATDWWVPYPQWSAAHEIEAYTDALSYVAGNSVQVMLSTLAADDAVRWRLYRTGWYGGAGARVILDGTASGNPQPLPPESAGAAVARAGWQPTFAFKLPRDVVSGVFALRLDSSVSGKSYFVTFTVREDGRRADLVVDRADYTDAAYNDWDGGTSRSSAYRGALWVALDRPLHSTAAQGLYSYSSGYFVHEYPMVRWLEQQGYDVKYISNGDLDARPQLLDGARAFLSIGHDEYWSPAMRDAVEAARDKGLHLGFFGADAVDGRIRFADRAHRTFSRTISNGDLHKLEYASQPLDPARPPHDNPSDSLTGTHYAGYCEVSHPACKTDSTQKLRVADDYRIVEPAHPLFRGLGSERRIPGTVGYEYEAPYADPQRLPFALHVLARAPGLSLHGVNPAMVAYRASSGAKVFNVGSMSWVHSLDGWAGRAVMRATGVERACLAGEDDCFVRPASAAAQITANALADFGAIAATPSPELTQSAAQPWP